MITYADYENFRKLRGMKDSDIAKAAGINQSVLSDWKHNKSRPKADKMQKIAEALQMDYLAFIGPVGKFSAYKPSDELMKAKGILTEVSNNLKVPGLQERLAEYAKRIAKLSGPSMDKLEDYLKYLESTEKNDAQS